MPNLGQSLGATRDQIRNNILDIKNSLAVNHVDLDNGADTGKHTMTNFIQISTAAQKPTTGATEVALYNDVAKTGQIWLCPPNTTQGDKKVQLTAGDVTDTKFATNTAYATNRLGGWTFLPGNLLLQYGSINLSTSAVSTSYPIAFSGAPYSLQVTPYYTGSAPSSKPEIIVALSGANPEASFTIAASNSNANGYFWQAIGPA